MNQISAIWLYVSFGHRAITWSMTAQWLKYWNVTSRWKAVLKLLGPACCVFYCSRCCTVPLAWAQQHATMPPLPSGSWQFWLTYTSKHTRTLLHCDSGLGMALWPTPAALAAWGPCPLLGRGPSPAPPKSPCYQEAEARQAVAMVWTTSCLVLCSHWVSTRVLWSLHRCAVGRRCLQCVHSPCTQSVCVCVCVCVCV